MSSLPLRTTADLRIYNDMLTREASARAGFAPPINLRDTLSSLRAARERAAKAHFGDYEALDEVLPAVNRLRGEGYSSNSDPMLNRSIHQSLSMTSLGRLPTPGSTAYVARAPKSREGIRDGTSRRLWDVDHHHFHSVKTGPAHWAPEPEHVGISNRLPWDRSAEPYRFEKPPVVRPSSRAFGEAFSRGPKAEAPLPAAAIEYLSPKPRRLGMHSAHRSSY